LHGINNEIRSVPPNEQDPDARFNTHPFEESPMTNSTYATLLDILHSELAMDPARVHIDSTLIGDLGFDSVAFAISVVAIEERFDLRVSEEKLFACETFGDVVHLIDVSKGVAPSADIVSVYAIQDRARDFVVRETHQPVGGATSRSWS
jgi:acyl carrier protein